ncbi:PREDICTED: kinectin-like [Amphimedon queenslandica]|uniref:MATH domain-containing protein n=1 Tax=Amphimedon queenslandica TaxID=400682 RepID=A0AAN0JDU3_AMPQE|nr:PREDICTED: kinectin-like [Amphimedon queenslandica]|eukprot:XP_019854917.1 PREDICTED: kinectin-like [Amphimedon queenslandica]
MNENAVADKLDQEKHNACSALAIDIFNTHHPLLSQFLTDPVSVAIMLQREGVITGQVLASVESASPSVPNQHEVLLAAIIVAIQNKYSLLQTFASVLCKFTGNIKLGTIIQRDYDKTFHEHDHLILDEEESSESSGCDSNKSTPNYGGPLYIPQCKSRDFDELHAKFAKMFSNVRKAISKCPPPLEDLKTFIEDFNSDLEAELSFISNLQSVMRLIRKNCSLINIVILEAVVEHFEINDAQKYIDDYKREIDESCRSLSVDLCLNEPFDVVRASPPLKCETATYVLGWEATEHKLKDVTDIVSKSSGKFIKLINIKSIESITITCSFPHSLTGALIIKLSENLELLIKNGLVKLTVGYCTIWKKQEPLEEDLQKIKEQSHDTKRQKELKETVQQLRNILNEKEKELNKIKEKLQEMSSLKKTKEDQNEEECALVELKEVKEATNDLKEKLQRIKKEYDIKCHTDSASAASYKIIKGMRMEKEQILTNKTGLLDWNESLIDIKREIAELQEQISLMSVHILNEREENEELMHKIKESLIDYKRDTLKLDQEISSEQTLVKREVDQQVIHQEIKEQLGKLIISVELHQTISKLSDDSGGPHTPPVEVLMTSFASHHKSNKHWYSPGFYSHHNGYKLCLRVRANGESEGSETHLSIYIHLMRGEYDDTLKWPVRGRVNLELFKRKHDKNHFAGKIEFNNDSNPEATGRVINGILLRSGTAAFVGEGGATFIPQGLLFKDYVKDDSIRIRITSVDLSGQGNSLPVSFATNGCIFEFRVNNFSALKKYNGSYVSDHFYTHEEEQGYSFVLMVYPNGVGANKGKNVSIFAHLTKGLNDDQLKFPFRGEFTVQAVNCHADQNHIEKVIRINEFTDPNETYGRRVAWYNVTGRALNGYGFPEFLGHEQLEYNKENNTQYLDDTDSILFRVTKVKVMSV